MSEKEVSEALKRMKKGKSSGPSEVTCEMIVSELCGLANGLLVGEYARVVEEEHGCSLV